MKARAAFTLVELIVVIAVLGITLSIVAIAPLQSEEPNAESARDRVARARQSAITSARTTSDSIDYNGSIVRVRAFADGRVVVDSALRAPDGTVR